jgi:excisionase family DNA binding protein
MAVKPKGHALLATSSRTKAKFHTTTHQKVGPRTSKTLKSRRGIVPVRQAAIPREGLMTMDEICAYTKIARSTIYRYLANGLKTYQHGPGGARRFLVGDVLHFLSRPASVNTGVVS